MTKHYRDLGRAASEVRKQSIAMQVKVSIEKRYSETTIIRINTRIFKSPICG